MESHWIKNIAIRLYTANPAETQHFYSVILGINCDSISSSQIIFSFQSTTFIFTADKQDTSDSTSHLSFEVNEADQFWEAIRFKVNILKPIADTADGQCREFTIFDNNGYQLHFYERNISQQLSLNFYDNEL